MKEASLKSKWLIQEISQSFLLRNDSITRTVMPTKEASQITRTRAHPIERIWFFMY